MAVVLITGATGYVAGVLIRTLLDTTQFRVRGTVRDLKDPVKMAPLFELQKQYKNRLSLVEADLLIENSFDEAVKNCLFVFHTASPFRYKVQDPQKELIEPAVKGTRNVLMSVSKWNKSAKANDIKVKKVVLTSSVATIMGPDSKPKNGKYFTDEDWNTTASLDNDPYAYSKVLAEKEAWEIAKRENIDLVTINPSFIIGPPLSLHTDSLSIRWMMSLLEGKVRNFRVPVVDVRDVAIAHIRAAQYPKPKGRYIVSQKYPLNPGYAAELVKRAVPEANVDVEGNRRKDLPIEGQVFENERAITDLDVIYTPVEKSVMEMAQALWGMLQRRSKL